MRIRLILTDPGQRTDAGPRATTISRLVPASGSVISVSPARTGPASLGSPYDAMLADIAALDAGMTAAQEGFDAVVLDDPCEPALDALRSRLSIPVTGPAMAAIWLGRLVGLPVALVAAAHRRGGIERALLLHDADTGTAFAETFEGDDQGARDAAIERALARGAATVVLGGPEADRWEAEGSMPGGVPVVTGVACAMALAEVLAGLSLRQSPRAWLPPAITQDALLTGRISPGVVPAPSVDATSARRTSEWSVQVIVPHSDMDDAALARRAEVIVPGLLASTTRVSYTGTRTSPNRADSPYATFLMDTFCFEQGLGAAAAGFDALTVDSTTDSGITALRSRLPILVVGTGSATWALAATISHRFSIVAMEAAWRYFYDKNLRLARLHGALASVEVVGTPTDPFKLFEGKEAAMFTQLEELARRAIDERGAEAIIIGSTTMHQASDHLAAALPVPVLNPGRVALRTLEALLGLGVRQSRVVSPAPARPADAIFG